jgi:hypothetical protein
VPRLTFAIANDNHNFSPCLSFFWRFSDAKRKKEKRKWLHYWNVVFEKKKKKEIHDTSKHFTIPILWSINRIWSRPSVLKNTGM